MNKYIEYLLDKLIEADNDLGIQKMVNEGKQIRVEELEKDVQHLKSELGIHKREREKLEQQLSECKEAKVQL